MEAAWHDRQLKKQSVNSLIGLWCIDEQKSYTARTSTHEGDRPLDLQSGSFIGATVLYQVSSTISSPPPSS